MHNYFRLSPLIRETGTEKCEVDRILQFGDFSFLAELLTRQMFYTGMLCDMTIVHTRLVTGHRVDAGDA